MQELWFLRSARRPMLIDIYMKFRAALARAQMGTTQAELCFILGI